MELTNFPLFCVVERLGSLKMKSIYITLMVKQCTTDYPKTWVGAEEWLACFFFFKLDMVHSCFRNRGSLRGKIMKC